MCDTTRVKRKVTAALCCLALSASFAGALSARSLTEKLTLKDSIAYLENVSVLADGSVMLAPDTSKPRLLTDNVGHALRYSTGATYRYLLPDGSEWKGSKSILTDGRVSEHSAIKVPANVRLEFDLKGAYFVNRVELYPYFYEGRGRVESIGVKVSLDGEHWDDTGRAETPYPVLTHATMAVAHERVERVARYVRISPAVSGGDSSQMIEVRIWGCPHVRRRGYLVTGVLDARDGDAITDAKAVTAHLCAPCAGTGEAISAAPLDAPEAGPLPAPASLTATCSSAEWPPGYLPANRQLHYCISAVDNSGETLAEAHASVKTGEGKSNSVHLSWQELPGAVAYRIYRGEKQGEERLLGTKSMKNTPLEDLDWNTYIDWGLKEADPRRRPLKKATVTAIASPDRVEAQRIAGVGSLGPGNYYYRISAWGLRGESAASAPVKVRVRGQRASVAINWRPVAGARGYKIYCCREGEAWEDSLVGRAGAGTCSWLDAGRPRGVAVIVRRRGAQTEDACLGAPWRPIDSESIGRFQQLRIDLCTADDQRTPAVRELILTRREPVGRAVHIGDRDFPPRGLHYQTKVSDRLLKSDKWIAFDVETRCELLNGYRYQESSSAAIAIQPGKIVYKVRDAGDYHLGIVFRFDMDGREEWIVRVNGKELERVCGDRWIWEWNHIKERNKNQNDYLWLTTDPIQFRQGDVVEVENDGPPVACYRIDRMLFVPPGVDVLAEIGLKAKDKEAD